MNKKLTIIKLSDNELINFKQLLNVFKYTFEIENFKMPSDTYLTKLLNNKDFHVFAAIIDNKVVAGLTAYSLSQYYSETPLMFIYDLAVLPSNQRLGIGKELIAHLKNYCIENGFNEMFVIAEQEDEYALQFYRSTGPNAQLTACFNYVLT